MGVGVLYSVLGGGGDVDNNDEELRALMMRC